MSGTVLSPVEESQTTIYILFHFLCSPFLTHTLFGVVLEVIYFKLQ